MKIKIEVQKIWCEKIYDFSPEINSLMWKMFVGFFLQFREQKWRKTFGLNALYAHCTCRNVQCRIQCNDFYVLIAWTNIQIFIDRCIPRISIAFSFAHFWLCDLARDSSNWQSDDLYKWNDDVNTIITKDPVSFSFFFHYCSVLDVNVNVNVKSERWINIKSESWQQQPSIASIYS